MSDVERLEACEVCGMIATDQVIMPTGALRYYCLNHLPEGVRPATDAEAAAVRGLDLQPIKERVAAASPAPWTWTPWDGCCNCTLEAELHESPDQCPDWYWSEAGELSGPAYRELDDGDYQWFGDADLDFIAHAREDVPALVAEVERLQQRAEEAEAALMLVDEYGRNCVHDASLGNDSTSFAVWLVLRESRRQRWRDEV